MTYEYQVIQVPKRDPIKSVLDFWGDHGWRLIALVPPVGRGKWTVTFEKLTKGD